MPLLLSLLRRCSFPSSTDTGCQNLPETTGLGQSQLPTGRPPLIGREAQVAAGASCDMTSHMRTPHGTCCHVDLQLLTELRSQHAYLYSQARFGRPITRLPQRAPVGKQRDGANVANDIIIDILIYFGKPANLSCICDIIFVIEYVLAFDECHS